MDDGTATTSGDQAAQQIQAAMSQGPPAATTPAQSPASPAPAATPAATPAASPASPAPAQAQAAPTQQPSGGLAGMMGSVLDMLVNRDQSTLSRDGQGNMVSTPQKPLTRGEQIARIGLTALKGATTAAAAAPGPGHTARGVAAAVGQAVDDQQAAEHAKQENADHDFAVQQKAKMDNVNYQLLSRQLVASEFDLQQKQVKATQDTVNFSNTMMEREKNLGSYDLGTYKDEREIPNVMAKQPAFMQKLYKEQGIIAVPVYGQDGERQGVQLFERKQDTNAQLAPQGAIAHRFVPGSKPGEAPSMQTFTPTGASNGDIARYDLKAMTDQQSYEKAQGEIAHTAAQTRESNANAEAKPQETQAKVMEAGARATEARASATRSYAEANAINQKSEKDGNDAGGGANRELVDDIGSGHVTPERMSYLLTRNPGLVAAVAQKYPDWDSTKASAYPEVVKDFSSSKAGTAGGQLLAGGTAMRHLAELKAMNTPASHVWGTPSHTAYENKVETVADEVAKFYGNTTIPAIDGIKKTLLTTLPGNRDAAIATQAKSMGDRFDSLEQTWRNGSPSHGYRPNMPNVSEEAINARANLDPVYRQRIAAGQPAPQKAAAPAPATHVFSPSAWQRANPQGDVNAAIQAAKAQNFTVTQ